jgi:hypothetical protein
MKLEYFSFNIRGMPSLKRWGHNTRKGSPKNYIYKVTINDNIYYIVRFQRSGKSFTKYFKKRKDAKEFLRVLAEKRIWK